MQKDGRHALIVDGRPYLILGGQIHNSSAWPSELPQIWESLAALHANTVEAPVYWEQLEPKESHFNFTNVDQIVDRPDGERIDVLSPLSRATLEADKAAFVTLVRHVKQIDSQQHTVLLIQVENESGNIGSVRDNSAEANRAFTSRVQ